MSSSSQLSIQRLGTNLPVGSKEVDKKLFDIMKQVGADISKNHDVKIYHDNLSNAELYAQMSVIREKHTLQSKRSGIRPDGKVLLIKVKGNKMPLLISENKKQGDGKNQARGNAIERAAKNIMFIQTWMAKEKILPYLLFCYGKDFESESYIIDRIATMTHNYPLNRINVYKDADGLGGVSAFYKDKMKNAFSEEEMYEICYDIAEKSLIYYMFKYGDLQAKPKLPFVNW